MIQRRFFITILGILATCLVIRPNPFEQQVQAQTSYTIDSGNLVEGIPFGNKHGLQELQALLKISQSKGQVNSRIVVIPALKLSNGKLLPKAAYDKILSRISQAEFHRIVVRELHPPSLPTDDFKITGKKGRLPNGGTLRLSINYESSPARAFFTIDGYKVPGYEQVNSITIVLSPFPTS